jgi:hypothetical protein
MPQHYTKLTLEVSVCCDVCGKETMHRVDAGRRGPCLTCLERLEVEGAAKEKKPPIAEPGDLTQGGAANRAAWPREDPFTHALICQDCWDHHHHKPDAVVHPADCACHCLASRMYAEAERQRKSAARKEKRETLRRDLGSSPLAAVNDQWRPRTRKPVA